MEDIFLHRSARLILRKFLESLKADEKKGANQKVARALGIFPSYLSLILSGERTLNLDQGILLSEYMKLKKEERRYLLRVIEIDRAQTAKLKEEINNELDEMIKKDHQIASKVDKNQLHLSLDEMLKFFSSWEFATLHLAPAIEDGKVNIPLLAKKYNLEHNRVREIVKFLLRTGLWVNVGKKIELGNKLIHLDNTSPLLNQNHNNWRLKAIERHPKMNRENELAYSLCIAISEKDVMKVKSILLKAVEDIRNISDPSESEIIYNLNMDWLKV